MHTNQQLPHFGYLVIDGVAQSDEPELISGQRVNELIDAGHTVHIY